MLQCWELEPQERPMFAATVQSLSCFLETMVDYMDIAAFHTNGAGVHTSPMTCAEQTVSKDDNNVFNNKTFIDLETIVENNDGKK